MIVFCHLLNDSSGSPRVLLSSIKVLSEAGYDGRLFVSSDGRGILEKAGIETTRYWYRRSRFRIVTLFTYAASQIFLFTHLSCARDIPKDAVVYVNTLLPFGAAIWGKLTGRKVIVHVHEVSITPALFRRFLTAIASQCASLLLFVSEDHKMRVRIDGPPSKVVMNPISPEIAARAERYIRDANGVFNALMFASLRHYKGVNEFMILARTLTERRDISFTLVLNAEPAEVSAFAAQHRDAANVSIYSRTDDPAPFYECADIVLNLSRVDQWIETFGLTVVEAMVFGLPVIVPPVGGPTEIVTHGHEGFCIDSRDIAALRAAVLLLADDPDKCRAMSRAARYRARDFTFERYGQQLNCILATL